MRNSRCQFVLAATISVLVIFLAGCGISMKQRSYDIPPEDDVNYEESASDSYYGGSPRAGTYRYYDPNYDPWTMGTYYQHYSGPVRTGGSSGSSNASAARSGSDQTESVRPAEKNRASTSVRQSQAPGGKTTSLRKSRTTARTSGDTTRQSSGSGVTSQTSRSRARREPSRTSQRTRTSQTSQVKKRETRTRVTSRRTSQKSSESESEEDEEKNTP